MLTLQYTGTISKQDTLVHSTVEKQPDFLRQTKAKTENFDLWVKQKFLSFNLIFILVLFVLLMPSGISQTLVELEIFLSKTLNVILPCWIFP